MSVKDSDDIKIYCVIWAWGWEFQIYQTLMISFMFFFLVTWFVHVTHTHQTQRKSQLIQTWVIICPVQICEKIDSIKRRAALLWIPWIRTESWQVLIFPHEKSTERCVVDKQLAKSNRNNATTTKPFLWSCPLFLYIKQAGRTAILSEDS